MGEAFRTEAVLSALYLFLGFLVGGVLSGWLASRVLGRAQALQYQIQFALIWTAITAGVLLSWFTFQQVALVYQQAFVDGTDPGIWPQIITISSGVVLIGLAWFFWKSAEKRAGTTAFWWRILAAFGLLVGGWILIGELPMILASGDPDLWEGLKVTVFFSVFTVPFQLSISLFLCVHLFD